jgi:hypothetical protein
LVIALFLASCTTRASGPIKHVCGKAIGRAPELIGSGPFYLDAVGDERSSLAAAAGASGTWLRVSSDCARGAELSVSPAHIVKIRSLVQAKDGKAVAVLVFPRHVGVTTILARRSGSTSHLIRVTVFGRTWVPSPPPVVTGVLYP